MGIEKQSPKYNKGKCHESPSESYSHLSPSSSSKFKKCATRRRKWSDRWTHAAPTIRWTRWTQANTHGFTSEDHNHHPIKTKNKPKKPNLYMVWDMSKIKIGPTDQTSMFLVVKITGT